MFALIVELYRLVNRPPIVGGRFSACILPFSQLTACLNALDNLNPRYGELEVEQAGSSLEIEFTLPASGIARFHNTFSDFIKDTPSLGRGELPTNFYVVADDWSTTDDVANDKFDNVRKVCSLIKSLEKLARVADESPERISNKLFFSMPGTRENRGKTFLLDTKLDDSILDVSLDRLQVVEGLIQESGKDSVNYEERRHIFCLAIADVLDEIGSENSSFSVLLRRWCLVLDKYENNLHTYLHGFSFDKVRGEIAKAELDFGTKIGGVLNDLTGKLLAIPVSLGALVAYEQATNLVGRSSIGIGVCLVSIIACVMLWNQWLNVRVINSAIDMVFDQYEGRLASYPDKVKNLLINSRAQINAQKETLRNSLLFFAFLALLPPTCLLVLIIGPSDVFAALYRTLFFFYKGSCIQQCLYWP